MMSRSSSMSRKYRDTTISTHETIDADHGRIETRNYTVIHDIDWLQARHQWPGLNAIVVVESRREINGKITDETRFYITSLVMLAAVVCPMIRAHWAIENSLHWVMDMVFRDDECRVGTANAPASFAPCRHIAYNLTRKAPGKDSIRLRRKTAGWDDEYLAPASSPHDFLHPIPLRSILCLCLGPGPRPNQRSLAYLSVSSMLPPLRRQRRLQRVSYFGAIARLQH